MSMTVSRRVLTSGAFALGVGVALGAFGSDAQAQGWEPKKPVEMIIMAGTGGGADQLARLIQSIIEQEDLSPRPFIPINKAGGSGAEALRYLQDKEGDDHTVLVTLNSFYTTPIINQGLGVDVTKFTPLGLMALDTFQLWVTSDSGIESLEDWVKAVKAADNWNVGGTGRGQEDSILFAMLEAEFGIDNITYIPFEGGGTVAKNLVGKHILTTVNNPAEQMGFYQAKQSMPLVQFTDERLELFPDVPTAKEMGHDIVYFMQRSFNAPPGMSEDAQAFYVDLFGKVFNSETWQKYCTDEGLMCENYVSGSELGAFHEKQIVRHKALIEKVGAKAITGE
jgi:tripartite-type tricarboxylate transporter receptor subunit TctC